ncbi:MAG: hypothetical protein QOJ50_4023, partial [Cryptosporangiaceae bacterium]|nr:hypothetical protein [Cryptosporangiaceae bacterium]
MIPGGPPARVSPDPLAAARVPPSLAGELGHLGEPVPWNAGRRIVLGGRDTLWLVTGGAVELYAAEAAGRGALEYLGTAPAGALICGSSRRGGRVVVARPHGGALRRLELERLARGRPLPAIAAGVDAGLRALRSRQEPPPATARELGRGRDIHVPAGQAVRVQDSVRWVLVQAGELVSMDGSATHGTGTILALTHAGLVSVQDSTLDVRDTRDLLGMGVLLAHLPDQQERFLAALDTRLSEQERRGSERLDLARRAGENAFASGGHVLRAAASRSGLDAHAAEPSAYQLVAAAAGIAVEGAAGETSTPERFAIAAGCRSRDVALTGQWWKEDLGPLA